MSVVDCSGFDSFNKNSLSFKKKSNPVPVRVPNIFKTTFMCGLEEELKTKLNNKKKTPQKPLHEPNHRRNCPGSGSGSRVRRVGSRLSITMKTIVLEINQLPKLPKHPNRPMSRGVQKARHRK
jgi:hypothetical protein